MRLIKLFFDMPKILLPEPFSKYIFTKNKTVSQNNNASTKL